MTRQLVVAIGTLSLALLAAAPASAQVVFSASGANTAAIQATVDAYRTALGTLNPNTAGSAVTGRREINWDGVPAIRAAPNFLPRDFFNVTSPRGVVFSTPDDSNVFQVSGAAGDPGADSRFSTITAGYSTKFAVFSPQRLFTARGGNVVDVRFFVPGSDTPATTRGFGAVLTDVDTASVSALQFFDAADASLGTFFVQNVPASEATLSFLGVLFASPTRVARVRITAGNQLLNTGNTTEDLVVMDDFLYGEPGSAPGATTGGATGVDRTAASLNGTVDPRGPAATYRFEYGTTTAYGSQAPSPDAAVGAGTSTVAVSQSLTGLVPNTTYHYRLVATNAVGMTQGADSTFTTLAPPVVAPAIALPPLDLAPVLSRLAMAPTTFRALSKGGSIAAAAGTTVTYRLSEDARVTFSVERTLPGRRQGTRCAPPSRANLRGRRCTRYRAVRGSFSRSGKSGSNRFRFTGRLAGKRLAPARYRLNGRARDAGGKRSAVARRSFTVVVR